MTRARIRLVLSLLMAAALAPELPACDSTGCLLVTRSAGGLLPRKNFRLDLSYRMTDDSQLMSGSDSATRVTRPKVDFETENYETWGLGDTLVGVRHAVVATAATSVLLGAGVESTGGTIVYAIPGFVASVPARLSAYLFLPIPVYRYVNETQVAPRLSLVLGMARSF